MVFLDGMTLDWKDSLIQSGFVFENPHAKKSCGCGTSFLGVSWTAAIAGDLFCQLYALQSRPGLLRT